MGSLNKNKSALVYDKGTMRVVVLACIVIIVAVVLTGSISYFITNQAMVEKLQTRDMHYIINSIAAQVNGKLERAKETAHVLAKDPVVLKWVSDGETDTQLGRYAKQKITAIARNYDYHNAFVVSNITRNYWGEDDRLIDVMSETDPDDAWFFETMAAGKPIDLNLDYNEERGDTFVFVNALMGNSQQPLAVAGVGLSLKELAKEFQTYKIGNESNLWLVDAKGKIYLAEDVEHTGKALADFLPSPVAATIINDEQDYQQAKVLQYTSSTGQVIDLAYLAAQSTEWKLVFQIPRSESIAMLQTIKYNTLAGSVISLIVIVFIFYFISNRIANPFKRALELTQEMELQVAERTTELAESNQKIVDSIAYAKRIQESVLPSEADLAAITRESFVIWRPRDVVGGDFYWVRQEGGKSLMIVADCTGHGVPGAFMTMALNSILDRLVDELDWRNPAFLLKELNVKMKQTIHRKNVEDFTDDGLDIGICFSEGHNMVFAGSKISLYQLRDKEVRIIPGHKRSIGYRRSPWDMEFVNHTIVAEAEDAFYMTTDGFLDQNGGERDYPLGRKRFVAAISLYGAMSMKQQQMELCQFLDQYRNDSPQRDDITMIGFRI